MPKQILKAYKVRLYPNDEQQVFFAKSFGCTRFIWNKMLSDKVNHYKANKTILNNTLLSIKKSLNGSKK
ncbi:helix-turn-helix domain-containing protein [Psychrobacter sp. 1Y1]|uniref:helix-turn-helix domain-containing protein n=1 Tax=Psychrobacter sp. 1Y1 TaxID=3453574 RepID=UPI003F459F0A